MNRRHLLVPAFALVAAAASATTCRLDRHRATPAECHEIFGRLVALEMEEQGFRDPVAVARVRERLGRELAPDVGVCERRRLAATALDCVRKARRAEEITHVCLE
jgi:hypothetical protein